MLLHGARKVAATLALICALLPASAAAAEPVILLHGFGSRADIWRGAEIALRDAGFDPIPVQWRPEPGQRAPQVAVHVVLPAIRDALVAHGHAPDAGFHAVGHSMGGLLLRFLIEHPWADVDDAWRIGGWSGDGVPDGDPTFAARVKSLTMISTPNQGARTGVAKAACALFPDPDWRPLGCDLTPDSPFVRHLGSTRPEGLATPYFSVGVSTAAPLFLLPPYDGSGDGDGRAHDNAVMAEATYLFGADWALYRGWTQSDHFHVTCSKTVIGWAIGFARSRSVPASAGPRERAVNLCAGVSKAQWRAANPVKD